LWVSKLPQRGIDFEENITVAPPSFREPYVRLRQVHKWYYNYYGFAGNAAALNKFPLRSDICGASDSTGEVSERVLTGKN
jgi:hypothetical protein